MSTEPEIEDAEVATATAASTIELDRPIEDGDVFYLTSGYTGTIPGSTLVQWYPDDDGTLCGLTPIRSIMIEKGVTPDAIRRMIADNVIDRQPRHWNPNMPDVHRLLAVAGFAWGTRDSSIQLGNVLVLADDGSIRKSNGLPYLNLKKCDRVMRVLSCFTVPVLDDGKVRAEHREMVSDVMPDLMKRPSEQAIAAVRAAPTSPIIRNMVRNFMGVPVPPDLTTGEAILGWMLDRPVLAPWNAEVFAVAMAGAGVGTVSSVAAPLPEPAPVRPAPVPYVHPGDRTQSVSFSVDVPVTGTVTWRRTDRYSGDMDIPLRVIARGEDAVQEYIMDHYMEWDDEPTQGDDRIDWDTTNSDGADHDSATLNTDGTDDFDDIQEQARENFPDYFDADDGDNDDE